MIATVVVAGPIHSGTSIVAGTLRHLGVFMGDTFRVEGTHEDTLFAAYTPSPELVAYVRHRNKDHSVWGFKWPVMRAWFNSIEPFLREPKYIYCHRELIPKMEKYGLANFAEALAEASYWAGKLVGKDVLVLGFDMPQEARIKAIVEYLNLTPTREQLDSALSFYNKERGYHAICKNS